MEDEETLALVRDLGVDYAQGFYVGRPVIAEDGAEASAEGVSGSKAKADAQT